MRIKSLPQMDLRLIIFSFICFIHINGYAQSNDAYLDALAGEAENLNLDRKTQSQPNSNFNPVPQAPSTLSQTIQATDGIDQNLSFDDFLNTIKSNYFGTYIFIKRLSEEQKQQVYQFYLQNNDPQAIRKEVIKISKKN